MTKQKGFTVIELMIATTIFSIILLVALAGFSGIGNLFYKGVAVTQTQSITSQVINDLKNNIQLATSVTIPSNASNHGYYCVDNVRYTYQLFHEYNSSQAENYSQPTGTNYGLLKDTLPGANGCAAPCFGGAPSGCVPLNKPQEVLATKMRLLNFSVATNPLNTQLYDVNVYVAYGDDADFSNVNDPNNMACLGGLNNQKFCAVIRLSSSVYEGLHS